MGRQRRKPAYHVRPVTRQNESRFVRLRTLKCFDEVHSRVIHGFPVSDIVRFIQQEKAEYVDIEPSSLSALLVEYRKSLPLGPSIHKSSAGYAGKAMVHVQEKLDELDELNRLFAIQMGRLDIDLKNEQSIKKLFPTTAREIEVARNILETSAKLKMDLGLDERHLGSLDVNADISAAVEKRYGGATARVMADPNSRRKILGVLERLRSVVPKAVSDDHRLPEGSPEGMPEVGHEEEVVAPVSSSEAEAG